MVVSSGLTQSPGQSSCAMPFPELRGGKPEAPCLHHCPAGWSPGALCAPRRALIFKVGRSSGTSGTVPCFTNEETEVQRVGKVATTPLERYPMARLDLEAGRWEIYWRRGCSPVENTASTQNPDLWNRAWMLLTAA